MDNRQSIMALVAFIVLLSTLIVHQFSSRRYERILEMRLKVDEQKEVLDLIRQNITDAETGHRGYLLSDNEFYKITYQRALTNLPVLIGILEKQYNRDEIIILLKFLNARIFNLNESIRLYDRGNKEEAIEILKMNEGKKLMDLCRAELDKIRKRTVKEEKELEKNFQQMSFLISNGLGFLHLVAIVLIALAMIPKAGIKDAKEQSPFS